MAYLELQSLRKSFGDVMALSGVDLSVARGEFLTLLGPSGCGKTTALRIVAGFESPDRGRVVDSFTATPWPRFSIELWRPARADVLFAAGEPHGIAFGARVLSQTARPWYRCTKSG